MHKGTERERERDTHTHTHRQQDVCGDKPAVPVLTKETILSRILFLNRISCLNVTRCRLLITRHTSRQKPVLTRRVWSLFSTCARVFECACEYARIILSTRTHSHTHKIKPDEGTP